MSVKRLIDLIVSFLAGMCLLPFLLFLCVLIKLTSKGPALFCQERIGLDNKPFCVWKLRTMYKDADINDYIDNPVLRKEWEENCKLDKDPRVVPIIGEFLRGSKLDELPQLWNVFKGEMSLVGPRPLPLYHVEKFDQGLYFIRSSVKPGMTGLWQIYGEGTISSFLHWDIIYVIDKSIFLDFKIILITLKKIFFT